MKNSRGSKKGTRQNFFRPWKFFVGLNWGAPKIMFKGVVLNYTIISHHPLCRGGTIWPTRLPNCQNGSPQTAKLPKWQSARPTNTVPKWKTANLSGFSGRKTANLAGFWQKLTKWQVFPPAKLPFCHVSWLPYQCTTILIHSNRHTKRRLNCWTFCNSIKLNFTRLQVSNNQHNKKLIKNNFAD